MKKLIVMLRLLIILVFSTSSVLAVELIQVKSNGKTVGSGLIGDTQIQATIITHEINIGKIIGSIPESRKRLTNCTYTRTPCSLIDNLEISINGKMIFVPRSVFTDISDLNTMVFSTKGKLFTLILKGGDASESYTVEITFDKNRVLKRRYFDAFDPNEVVQETNYYLPTPIE